MAKKQDETEPVKIRLSTQTEEEDT